MKKVRTARRRLGKLNRDGGQGLVYDRSCTIRLDRESWEALEHLKAKLGVKAGEVIRRALRVLA